MFRYPNASTSGSMWGHWSDRRSGRALRSALYSADISLRPEAPASQTTTVVFGPYSVRIFTSIEANPKIAFVGAPFDVAIVSGSA